MPTRPPPPLAAVPCGPPGLEQRPDDELMQLACAGLEAALAVLVLYVQENDASGRSTLHELNAQAGSAPVRLEELPPTPPQLAARGNRLFGELFTRPYGPTALAAYATAMVDAPAPVFGLSSDDQSRMHHYLTQVAGYGRSRRVLSSTFAFGYAGIAASAAIALASFDDRSSHTLEIGLTSGFAALFLGMGLNTALRPSDGERALASYERELKQGPAGGARALAETELWLERMARRARVGRKLTLWTMQVLALTMLTMGTTTLLVDDASSSRDQAKLVSALWYSGGALVSAYGLVAGLEESAAERMLRLYRSDSGLSVRVSPSLGTTGLGLRLSGSF